MRTLIFSGLAIAILCAGVFVANADNRFTDQDHADVLNWHASAATKDRVVATCHQIQRHHRGKIRYIEQEALGLVTGGVATCDVLS